MGIKMQYIRSQAVIANRCKRTRINNWGVLRITFCLHMQGGDCCAQAH